MKEVVINARIDSKLLEEIDSLIPLLAEQPMIRDVGARASRSMVIRAALVRGVATLRQELETDNREG